MDDQVDPCRVWWDDESRLARAQWRTGGVCTIDTARSLDAKVADLGHGRVPALIDIREIASIERAAREFFMAASPNYSAIALLAGSAATRMMANFFLRLNSGGNPVKMFTVESDALVWLNTHR